MKNDGGERCCFRQGDQGVSKGQHLNRDLRESKNTSHAAVRGQSRCPPGACWPCAKLSRAVQGRLGGGEVSEVACDHFMSDLQTILSAWLALE